MSLRQKRIYLSAVLLLAVQAVPASEKTTERTTEVITSTVITRTVVTEKEKTEWKPFKVCVLDFTTIDAAGQKQFLDQNNNPIVIPPQCTLNDADRKSVNSVMQGFVRMIDAWSNKKTADSNRNAQEDDNRFTRAKALELYHTAVKGQSRPAVIGAEYLAAYLGRRNDVFTCMDPTLMGIAMNRLQSEPDFPQDFMLKLAWTTGATHLIYGTVSDLRTQSKSFQGYGIRTKTTVYQLDVIIKMVDLVRQSTVYTNVYTGSYREQRPGTGAMIDHNVFQTLIKSALEQAAEELYDKCKPGRRNEISVTPIPYKITVNPSGGMMFKPQTAEIYIDGTLAGKGGNAILVTAGKHKITVKAAGFKERSLDLTVSKDAVIDVKLEK